MKYKYTTHSNYDNDNNNLENQTLLPSCKIQFYHTIAHHLSHYCAFVKYKNFKAMFLMMEFSSRIILQEPPF